VSSFELPEPEWITVGTIGLPGQRTFYLQARQGDQTVTLKLEKQQVAALCALLGELLADLPATPAATEAPSELIEPVLAEWVVGGMQLAYDESLDRIVVLVEEVGDPAAEERGPDDEPVPDTSMARLMVTRAQATYLIGRGAELVESGRATCPLCGHPMDPAGHSCPRTNGHKAPTP